MTLITILGILILKNINYANTIKTNVEVKYTAPILMKYGNIKINRYDLNINKQIDNNLVYSMIINGYPYKTLAELRS